jgi:hypothetical protein
VATKDNNLFEKHRFAREHLLSGQERRENFLKKTGVQNPVSGLVRKWDQMVAEVQLSESFNGSALS